MTKIYASLLAILTSALAALGIAFADEHSTTGTKLGPGLRLESGFGTELRHTDNMYLTSTNEVSAVGFLLTPSVALAYSLPASNYTLGYRGEWGEYDTSSEDDYQDNEVYFDGNVALLAKHHLDMDASYKRGHDGFGTNRTQASAFSNQELDIWDRAGVNAKYTYGGNDAPLNVYVKAGVGSVEYRTNRTNILSPTTGTRFLDNETDSLGGGVVYRYSPKTSFLLDYDHTNIDYQTDSTPSLDGELGRLLVGTRWIATGKTTGELWIGHYARDFDDPSRQDLSGADWKVRVLWNPRVRTGITLTTGKTLTESYLIVNESLISSGYVDLDWRQDWMPRLYTNVSLGYAEDDYEGTARSDDRTHLGTSLGYELSSIWTATAGASFETRDSSNSTFDYDRNTIFLGINGKF